MSKKQPAPEPEIPEAADADEYRTLVLRRTGLKREELQCPREKSDMTPCLARDGQLAVATMYDRAICVGCEANLQRLLREERAKHAAPTTPAAFVVSRDTAYKLPSLPNYVLPVDGSRSIPIEELTDEQLRTLGTQWVDALVAHAQRRRSRPVEQTRPR